MACGLLVSAFHCYTGLNCRIISVLLYAWLLESPLNESLLWPLLLGFILPCFPPKVDWHANKKELHRWITQHCRLPKRVQNKQAEERKMARLLQELRAKKLWTAADDERAQSALQQQDPVLMELARFLLVHKAISCLFAYQ